MKFEANKEFMENFSLHSEDKGWQSSQILPKTTARKRSVNYVARQNLQEKYTASLSFFQC